MERAKNKKKCEFKTLDFELHGFVSQSHFYSKNRTLIAIAMQTTFTLKTIAYKTSDTTMDVIFKLFVKIALIRK